MLGTLYFLKMAKISSRKHKKSPIRKNKSSCHTVLQNCHIYTLFLFHRQGSLFSLWQLTSSMYQITWGMGKDSKHSNILFWYTFPNECVLLTKRQVKYA